VIPLAYSLRSIVRRRFSAGATTGGLALVVFVFAAVFMLAAGVEQTLRSTGSRDDAVVLRKGSTSELVSIMPHDAARTFAADAAVAVEGGRQVASPEVVAIFQLTRSDGTESANVGFRGVTKDGWELLRSHTVKLVEGRLPQWGTSEVMLGRATRGRYRGAQIGQSISIARRQWQVVGVFDASGSAFESEIWGDADQIAAASRRTGLFSSLTVKLRSPSELNGFQATVEADPRWNLEARREDKFFESQSGQLAAFIRFVGKVIAIFFSLGAILGAMITMYAQVASRGREIGTLRAIGFGRWAVLQSFLVESLILAVAGGILGCILASTLSSLNFTTTNFGSFTETRFRFQFTPLIGLQAAIFAAILGILGGLLPAVRAARLQIAEAVKG
jgi:ABC-type lipoprotein release transport system permease subunit